MSLSTRRKKTWAWLVVLFAFQWTGALAAPGPGGQRSPSVRWAQQLQRAVAHQRMKNTMYASTPSSPANGPMCPALVNLGRSRPVAVDLPGSFSVTDETLSDDDKARAALDFFLKHISGPVVQAKCVNCHVEGGVSGHTRLVFQPSSTPDHGAKNLDAIRKLLSTVEDGAERILNKIQGVGHGGGVQVPAGSADFANMERLLELLGYGDGSGTDLTPETLFDTVTMASPGKTLRRAALIFGGEIPTREEMEAVDNGTEEDLRTEIRKRMTGRGFHEFLVRASNDRLLTDRDVFVIDPDGSRFVDFNNLVWMKGMAAFEKGYEDIHADPEFDNWWYSVNYGFLRAPLELIAYVVENDLPYTEVLTADYIMANPMAAEAYGAATQFKDVEDPLEFRPSKIVSYYRDDESKVTEYRLGIGNRVLDPGNLSTDYPHAGILNTTVFLLRYPTTPTNRNRARSRWTYYHFLGLDIEKSASRTTDPVALADTDNPTMKNPACTVCHRVMDPVAGAFQNYGEEGHYRDEWEGLDSLDEFYKYPPDGSYTPYQYGDSWYRDMRDPGFDGEVAPNSENSLQWLAERIVADDRFAEATVKFWWPALLGVEIATPPEDENDSDFEAMLLASNAQSAEVERLAEAFRAGIAGGKPYNLKDLLVSIVLSPWFRAESITDDDPVRAAALRNAGVERLLTPEELIWKTQTITGYGWHRHYTSIGTANAMTDVYSSYGLAYGGIDSDAVTERADEMTTVMAAVAQSHAAEVSCPIVRREFLLLPDEKRHLFGGIDEHVSPVSEFSGTAVIEADSWKERETNSWSGFLTAGDKNVRLRYPNSYWDPETELTRDLILDVVIVRDQAGAVVSQVELETLPEVILWNKPTDEWESGCEAYHYYNEGKRRPEGYSVGWCTGWLDVPISIPADGDYQIEVIAFQKPAIAGEEDAKLEMVVESDIETSQGAMAIRNKLVQLHDKLLGADVDIDSPDVEAAFQLFVEVWKRERELELRDEDSECGEEEGCWLDCPIHDQLYFDGIADDIMYVNEWGHLDFNWDRVNEIQDEVDWYRRRPEVRAWVAVMAYLLMDYRYLYLAR